MRALKYLGVRATTPPNIKSRNRAPLPTDIDAVVNGDLWLQDDTNNVWMLTSKANNIATWTKLDSAFSPSPTFDDVIINNTLTVSQVSADDVTINSSLTLDYINYASTLRTLADGSVYGLADGIDKDVYMGRTGDTSVWGQLESAGSTVAITKTATGINFEAAGGVSADNFFLDDGNTVVPTAAGQLGVFGLYGIETEALGSNSILITLKLDINEQAGTAYELIATDALKEIRFTSASAVTLTVPSHAVIPYETGTQILLVQYGTGVVTVVGAGGVAINSCGGRLTLYEQYSACALIKQSVSSWLLAGDIR